MAAYVIGEIEVTDPATYEEYGKQVLATVEKFGGTFIVRGGKAEAFEGAGAEAHRGARVPEPGAGADWYRSPEYAPLIKLRQKASRGRLIVVEGA